MTYPMRIIVGTLLWVVYGIIVWRIAVITDMRKAVFMLGSMASVCYFLLLTVLFFPPKKP